MVSNDEWRNYIDRIPGWTGGGSGEKVIRCPYPDHEDKHPSCKINADDGVFICFSCGKSGHITELLKDLGIYTQASSNGQTEYDYTDAEGNLVYQSVRWYDNGEKSFYIRRPGNNGEWIKKNVLKGRDPLPFNLPGIRKAIDAGNAVFIVEGEKDCLTLKELGIPATTNHGGANKWKDAHTKYFENAKAIIIPDADIPGKAHAETVATALKAHDCQVKVIDLGYETKEDHGKDISDWLQEGHDKLELFEIVKNTAEWDELEEIPGFDTDEARVSKEKVTPEEQKPRFKFTAISEIELTPPLYQIHGFLEQNTQTVIFGDPESGKSFMGVDWACRIATGTDFHGHTVRPGPVIAIVGEGQRGYRRRVEAWSIKNSIPLSDIPLFVSYKPAALTDMLFTTYVCEAIDRVAEEHGAPAFVLIDSLFRNFGVGNPNSTEDMVRFVDGIERIRLKYECCCATIHHSGHADKSRAMNSIVLKAALDHEYKMSKDVDGIIRLEAKKMKDAEPPEPMAFKLCSVELNEMKDEDGEPVTSAILLPTDYTPNGSTASKGHGKNQQIGLRILKDEIARHQDNLELGGYDPEGARVTLTTWNDSMHKEFEKEGKKVNSWRVRNSLENGGIIKVEDGYVYLK